MNPGLKFMTIGTSEKVTLGADLGITIGINTKLSLANTVSLTAGMSNTVGIGQDINFKGGPKLQWNNSNSYTIDDGTAFSYSKDKDEKTTNFYQISSGVNTVAAAAELDALEALRASLKKSLKIVSTVNIATGVALGATMLGVNKGDGSQNVLEDGKADHIKWSAPIAAAAAIGVSTLTSAILFKKVFSGMEAVMEKIKALARRSTIRLDNNGIEQTTAFSNSVSIIKMGDKGITFDSVPVIPVAGHSSNMILPADGKIELEGGSSTMIKSPKKVLVGQISAAGVVATGLAAEPEKVVLKNTAETTVTLTSKSAKISSPEISVLAGAIGFSADANNAKMACGAGEVIAKNTSLSLSVMGNSLNITSGSVKINGAMIKLG